MTHNEKLAVFANNSKPYCFDALYRFELQHDRAANLVVLALKPIDERRQRLICCTGCTPAQQLGCRNKSCKLGLTLQNQAHKVGASQGDRLLIGESHGRLSK